MISHQHKVIFIHIPKCAGRSISDALGEPFDHYTAFYYEQNYKEQWAEYTVFTTVRNPYQRLVSMYHYIKNEPFHAAHPITGYGSMIPFKDWVLKNISTYAGDFDFSSAEGNRETDGEWGSPFWFSSQARRISSPSGDLYGNISRLRYEEGMQVVEDFLHQNIQWKPAISHLNRSPKNERTGYSHYYDDELLAALNAFSPFAEDCAVLRYAVIETMNDWREQAVTISA